MFKTGELLIASDDPNHPKTAGIPSGHPVLNNFMGIPISYNGEMFAMTGAANNKIGYQIEDEILFQINF